MTGERMAWLEQLPRAVSELQNRWSLAISPAFSGAATSCAWAAPAVRRDGTPVVLKIGMPHFEGQHEVEGLRFWDGNPTVRLLEADAELNAMLLERCEPGTSLRSMPEPDQDLVIADLLRRLWRRPLTPYPFRPLSLMLEHWAQETASAHSRWTDPGLVRAGLNLFKELAASPVDPVLLATDLHAGNVLRAQRAPWLVIDPKPFVGDRAYDATQHLFNCRERVCGAPDSTIRRFADLLDVGHERVRLWMFARAAAQPRDDWNDGSLTLARVLG
jgi:streptomycin 6-kinase